MRGLIRGGRHQEGEIWIGHGVSVRVSGGYFSERRKRASQLRWAFARAGLRFGEWGWVERTQGYEFELWEEPLTVETVVDIVGRESRNVLVKVHYRERMSPDVLEPTPRTL